MEDTHRFYIVKNEVSLNQNCETLAPVIQNSFSRTRALPSLQPVTKAHFDQYWITGDLGRGSVPIKEKDILMLHLLISDVSCRRRILLLQIRDPP